MRSCEKGRIVIDPLGDGCIQPSSVDLHVDRHFRLFRNHSMRVIDVREDLEDLTELVEVADGDALILHPGEFVLGSTRERVSLPDDLVARLEGKSSLGRLGLLIHSTAGFVDAGWDGHLTLELSNVANLPITVYPGMKIGQISFLQMTTAAEQPLRFQGPRFEVPGPAGTDPEPLLRELPHGSVVPAGRFPVPASPSGGDVPVRIAIGMAVTVLALAVAGRRFFFLFRLVSAGQPDHGRFGTSRPGSGPSCPRWPGSASF